MSLYKNTKKLLHGAGCRPRKRLGQNFLVDIKVLDTIVEEADLSSDDVVLEIGAGTGILTQRLALSFSKVIAVEVDLGLFHILQSTCKDKPNVVPIHADIMDLNFTEVLAEIDANQYKNFKIIGNLPYYITKPVLMKILDESSLVPMKMALVMLQKEVGARLAASPGTKDYGVLSIATAYRSNAQILGHISAESFYPRPKVDSVLVKLSIRSNPFVKVKDERLFFQVVKAAFQYRRKTLRNALTLAMRAGDIQLQGDSRFDKHIVDSAIEALKFDSKRRGETLSIAEFAELANVLG